MPSTNFEYLLYFVVAIALLDIAVNFMPYMSAEERQAILDKEADE